MSSAKPATVAPLAVIRLRPGLPEKDCVCPGSSVRQLVLEYLDQIRVPEERKEFIQSITTNPPPRSTCTR
jgi:hypothetical protein